MSRHLGYVVLNDYGAFAGCRTALHEFADERGPQLPLMQIDQDAYYFQKPAPATAT